MRVFRFLNNISPARRQFYFSLALTLLALGAIFWITTFKMMDRDFWWHIKAGEIMLKTRHLIAVEPFSFTRAGQPYLATYEWLAQMTLYLIYHFGGYVGIILFRGVIASASVGLLLLLSKRWRFLYLLLAVWAVVMTKGSYLERPQLFTFISFSAFLLLAFRFLDAQSFRSRVKICCGFLAIQLLWISLHGGAALLGCAVVTFLFLQTLVTALDRQSRYQSMRSAWLLLGTLFFLGLALFSPPNGLKTVSYLHHLLTDQTIAFIAEWQPRDFSLYMYELWPFIVIGFLSLVLGRRHWVWNGLIFFATLYLSRQAFRHEILFVYASIATTFYQLDRSEWSEKYDHLVERYTKASIGLAVFLIIVLGSIGMQRSFSFERMDNLFGYGQFDFAKGAVDFLEREKITGTMFNTYGIGGYLLYRGYPDRKVFIDGRNVDYGLDFMARTYAGGVDVDRWKELEDEYKLTYAVVDYDAIRTLENIPYSQVLDVSDRWVPVYIDDWTAVYLKKIPENMERIQRLGYKLVTPTDLQFHDDFKDVPTDSTGLLQAELRRVQASDPRGIKATMALMKLALSDTYLDDAEALGRQAISVRPYAPEPYGILAAVYVTGQKWREASDAYQTLLRLVGDQYPDINYGFIASVFERAGDKYLAWYYRPRSQPIQLTKPSDSDATDTRDTTASGAVAPMVNPALDAQEYNEQGIAEAERKLFDLAEQSFLTSLKLNPSSAEVWNNLCAVQLQLKRPNDAIESCSRSIELFTESGDAYYNRALGYVQLKRFNDAMKDARSAQTFGREKEGEQILLMIEKMKVK